MELLALELFCGSRKQWLWRARNDFIFSRKQYSIKDLQIQISYSTNNIKNSVQLNSNLLQSSNSMNFGRDGIIIIPDDFVMVHCDGSAKNAGRRCGCGGIFRDRDSRFLLAFSSGLESNSVLYCELFGILQAIRIGLLRGMRKLCVCSDSLEALVEIFSNSRSNSYVLVNEILNVVDGSCDIRWFHIPRDFNLAADCLADCNLNPNVCNIYDFSPPHLDVVLNKEMAEGVGPVVA